MSDEATHPAATIARRVRKSAASVDREAGSAVATSETPQENTTVPETSLETPPSPKSKKAKKAPEAEAAPANATPEPAPAPKKAKKAKAAPEPVPAPKKAKKADTKASKPAEPEPVAEPEAEPEYIRLLPENVIIVGIDTDDGPGHPLYHGERNQLPLDRDLLNGIRTYGVQQAVKVSRCAHPTEPGTFLYYVVDGRQRVRHAREINLRRAVKIDIPCQIVPDSNQVEDLAILLNAHRQADSILSQAELCANWLARNGNDEPRAATLFKTTKKTIQNWGRVLLLEPAVKAAIKADQINGTQAIAMLGLTPEQQLAVLDKIAGKDLTVAETKAIVADVKKPQAPEPAPEGAAENAEGAAEGVEGAEGEAATESATESTRDPRKFVYAKSDLKGFLRTYAAHPDRFVDAAGESNVDKALVQAVTFVLEGKIPPGRAAARYHAFIAAFDSWRADPKGTKAPPAPAETPTPAETPPTDPVESAIAGAVEPAIVEPAIVEPAIVEPEPVPVIDDTPAPEPAPSGALSRIARAAALASKA